MDFLGLFDPSSDESGLETDLCEQLPPEPQIGNIEYKLKLINPTKQRFEHLVTQMKWRLREGGGHAVYELGVEDNGALTGLCPSEMHASLRTLERMARALSASTRLLREQRVTRDASVAEVLVTQERAEPPGSEVRVAVLGSADAGKSTLVAVLSHGQLDNGRGKARLNTFRHLHEIRTGRTSSIAHETLAFDRSGSILNHRQALLGNEEIMATHTDKLVTLLDLAGHQKYARTTLLGLTGYSPHHAILAISVANYNNQSVNSFISGSAKEHLAWLLALELPFCIALTKCDLLQGGNSTDKLLTALSSTLSKAGCKKTLISMETSKSSNNNEVTNITFLATNIPVFFISAVNGFGLDSITEFLHRIKPQESINTSSKQHQNDFDKNTSNCEFLIEETIRVPHVGTVVAGLVTQGELNARAQLVLGPLSDGKFVPARVQSIHRNKTPCRRVPQGQTASLVLAPLTTTVQPRRGMALVSAQINPQASLFFQARVVVLWHRAGGGLKPGTETTVHVGTVRQTAQVKGILRTEGRLRAGDAAASVLFRFGQQPEYIRVGQRILFRSDANSAGLGHITQIFPVTPPDSDSSNDL